jgi:hypothetical protein
MFAPYDRPKIELFEETIWPRWTKRVAEEVALWEASEYPLLIQSYRDCSLEGDEMDMACSTHERYAKCIKYIRLENWTEDTA